LVDPLSAIRIFIHFTLWYKGSEDCPRRTLFYSKTNCFFDFRDEKAYIVQQAQRFFLPLPGEKESDDLACRRIIARGISS
jgi:hypothetical protein